MSVTIDIHKATGFKISEVITRDGIFWRNLIVYHGDGEKTEFTLFAKGGDETNLQEIKDGDDD